MIKKILIYSSVTLSCVVLVFAARTQPRLTVQQAVAIALKNNIGVEIGRNNTRIAAINNSYGIAGGLPVVAGTLTDQQQSISINQQYANPANNKQSNDVGSNALSAGVAAAVVVTNGEKIVSEKKRLEAVESQLHKQLNSRMQLPVVNVLLKYYDIVRQQSYARVLQTSIDASKQKLDIVKNQQSVGLANNADLYQAQVDLVTQVQLLQAQQLVVDQDKTDLLYLLTLNPDTTINISDTIIIEKGLKLDTILNNLVTHPDITAQQDQVLINQLLVTETAAQRYPSVSLNAGYSLSRSQYAAGFTLLNLQRGPYAAVTVNIPFYTGGIFKRQQKEAVLAVTNAGLQKDTLINSYTANAIKNWQAYQSNLQQLETARENYELSQKLLQLMLQKFQYRQATIIDVKTAQQSFEDAANLLVNVSYAGKAAEILLKRYGNLISY